MATFQDDLLAVISRAFGKIGRQWAADVDGLIAVPAGGRLQKAGQPLRFPQGSLVILIACFKAHQPRKRRVIQPAAFSQFVLVETKEIVLRGVLDGVIFRLEGLDDVQRVYTNLDIPDEVLANYEGE